MTEIIQMSAIRTRPAVSQSSRHEPACTGPCERKIAADTGASALPEVIGNQRHQAGQEFLRIFALPP
jgi:hypothetical protein